MLTALARLYQVTENEQYAQAIQKNVQFLKSHQYHKGQLLHVYSKGQSKVAGFLDDYAYLIQGLIEAFEALFEPELLLWAQELSNEVDRRFKDDREQSYFYNQDLTATEAGHLLHNERYKEEHDASMPSPVAVMIENQLRLFGFFEEKQFLTSAEVLLKKYGQPAVRQPYTMTSYLNALDFYLQQPVEILVLKGADENFAAFRRAIAHHFLPNRIVLVQEAGEQEMIFGRGLLQGRTLVQGATTVYVCKGQSCSLPVTTIEALQNLLP